MIHSSFGSLSGTLSSGCFGNITGKLSSGCFCDITGKFSSGCFWHKKLAASIHRGWTRNLFSFTAQRDFSVPASVETTCVTVESCSVKHVAPNCSAIFHRWWCSAGNLMGKTRLNTILQSFNTSFLIVFKT